MRIPPRRLVTAPRTLSSLTASEIEARLTPITSEMELLGERDLLLAGAVAGLEEPSGQALGGRVRLIARDRLRGLEK
jgi:hypothetical protein